jgi:transcriptional antiterminator NusG
MQRIDTMNMKDKIYDVIVPKESQLEVKRGKQVTTKKRIFPGYVLVDMTVTDESWYVVRNTPNVTGFIGSGIVPVPVPEEEIEVMKRRMGVTAPKHKIDFEMNENVQIIDGPFAGYTGLISEIDEDKGKLKVLVDIFGRETPVELDFTQIKKT